MAIVGRPSRDEMFMQLAHVVAYRSTCQRAHVGAIITNMDGTSIKSMGYNGNARGLTDGCDTTTPGLCGCLHAEENALLKAPYGPPLTMFTTASPCLACAKRILNSSVRRIVYDQPYRDNAGLVLLTEPRLGLQVDRVDGNIAWRERVKALEADIRALNRQLGERDGAIMGFMKLLSHDIFVFEEGALREALVTSKSVKVSVPVESPNLLRVEVR